MYSLSLSIPSLLFTEFETTTEDMVECQTTVVEEACPEFQKVDVIVSIENLERFKQHLDANFGGITIVSEHKIDPSTNWLEQSYQAFPPTDIGDFCIYGSHIENTPDHLPYALCVDAATAFGSGEHGTTKGCLLAMQQYQKKAGKPGEILDLGCGSGILALAARLLWPNAKVLASDVDDEAIRVTKHHASLNGSQIESVVSEGFDALCFKKRRFDLIIANILANPLIYLAPSIHAHTAEGGLAILSGILEKQADDVISAYKAVGFTVIDNILLDGWVTVTIKK